MVYRTDIPDRNRGQTRPRYSANVAPTYAGQDDRRSSFLRNRAIQDANEVRQRRATVENPQWAMSRPAEFYTNRDNLRSIKDTLVNIPAVTTDMNETRNMYSMLMSQMRGGNKGARLIDTRGLPTGARRIGRKLFQDPSKSQGFFGDMRTMYGDLTPAEKSPNPAAVRVPEYNPFPKAGFGEEFYKKEFPIASGLGSLMEAAQNVIPYASTLSRILPKNEREILERHPDYLEGGSEFLPEEGIYNEIPEIPFMGDEPITSLPQDAYEGSGMETNPFYNTDLRSSGSPFDTMEDLGNTLTRMDITNDIVGDGDVITPVATNLSDDDYSPFTDTNITTIQDPELREAAKNAAYNFIMAYKSGDSGMAGSDTSLEALEDLYRDAVRVGQEQNINLETQDAEEKLEDINKQIQEEYDKQKELGFRYEL